MHLSIHYTRVQCVRGWGWVWGSGPQTDKHLPQSPFTGEFFKMTTFCIAFYESYLFAVSSLPHSYTPILTSRPSFDLSSLYHLSHYS
jgi:hypothetical protein